MPIQPTIIRIDHAIEGDPQAPVPPERLVSGTPVRTIANVFSDPSQAFHCGIWESSPGIWRVVYTEHEFCHMLAGRIRIVGEDGAEEIFATGDSFVIPAGFEGVWEVLEPARKLYAVYEP